MNRLPWLLPSALLGLFAGSAAAQVNAGGNGTPAPAPAPTRTEKRAQDMREQIDTGKQVQSHVRVSVRLKNGNKLVGVVKDGRFVERVDGLRFVEAQAQESGAGIRLWYSAGTRSYVFLPFAQFVEYEVLQRLSTKDLATIEQQMQMEEKRAAERAAAAAKAATGDATAAPTPDAGGDGQPAPAGESGAGDAAKSKAAKTDKADKPDDAAAKQQEQEKLWFRLVSEYPPTGGWNQAKCDEIKRRKAVVGAAPSAAEQFFADNFGEWQKACAHFGVSAEAKADDGGDAGTTGKSRRSNRKTK